MAAAAGCIGTLASRPACLSTPWRPLLAAPRRAQPLQAGPAGTGALFGAHQMGGPRPQPPKPRPHKVRLCASSRDPGQAGSTSGSTGSASTPPQISDIDRKILDASLRMQDSLAKAKFELFKGVTFFGLMWLVKRVVLGQSVLFDRPVVLTLPHEGRHPPTSSALSVTGLVLIFYALDTIWYLFGALYAWATLAWLKWQQRQQGRQQPQL